MSQPTTDQQATVTRPAESPEQQSTPRPSLPRPFLVEARRGYGKWLAVLIAGAGIVAATTRLSDHTQDWPAAVVLLASLGLIMGPLAIGVAAFAGGRAKRRDTFWIEDARAYGRVRAAGLECGALLVWALLGYLVVVAVCFVPTAVQATWSGPDMPRVLASLAGVLAQVAIGFFVGRLVPFALTAPIMASVSFSLSAVVNSAPHGESLLLFLPANQDVFDFYNRTLPGASFAEIGFYAGCALLVAAGWAVLGSPRTPRIAPTIAAALAVVVLVGSGVALSTYHGLSNTFDVRIAFTCQGTAPVICTHPATRDAQGPLRARFKTAVDLLDGTPFAIARAEQRPRGVGSTPTAGSVGFGLDNRTSSSVAEAKNELAHNAISQRARCVDRSGRPLAGTTTAAPTLIAALGDRVAYGQVTTKSDFDIDPRVNAAITYITSRTDAQLRQLLDRDATAIRDCTLTPTQAMSA